MEELLLAISTTKGMWVRLWYCQGNGLWMRIAMFFFFCQTWIYFTLVKLKIPFQLRSRINAVFMSRRWCIVAFFLPFIVPFSAEIDAGKRRKSVSARRDEIGLPVFPANCFLPFRERRSPCCASFSGRRGAKSLRGGDGWGVVVWWTCHAILTLLRKHWCLIKGWGRHWHPVSWTAGRGMKGALCFRRHWL